MPRQTSHTVQASPQKTAPQKTKERDPVAAGARDASVNRAASHNYFLLEKFEAGIALRGTEVKSIREGKANLKDAYGLIKRRRGLFAERAYRSVLPRQCQQSRVHCGRANCC